MRIFLNLAIVTKNMVKGKHSSESDSVPKGIDPVEAYASISNGLGFGAYTEIFPQLPASQDRGVGGTTPYQGPLMVSPGHTDRSVAQVYENARYHDLGVQVPIGSRFWSFQQLLAPLKIVGNMPNLPETVHSSIHPIFTGLVTEEMADKSADDIGAVILHAGNSSCPPMRRFATPSAQLMDYLRSIQLD